MFRINVNRLSESGRSGRRRKRRKKKEEEEEEEEEKEEEEKEESFMLPALLPPTRSRLQFPEGDSSSYLLQSRERREGNRRAKHFRRRRKSPQISPSLIYLLLLPTHFELHPYRDAIKLGDFFTQRPLSEHHDARERTYVKVMLMQF